MAAPLAVLEPLLGLTQPSGSALRVPVVVASRCQEPGLGVHLVLLARVEQRRPQHRHVLPGVETQVLSFECSGITPPTQRSLGL